MTIYLTFYFGIILYFNLTVETNRVSQSISLEILNEEITGMSDLQPGDILVKPNHNWLPGTSLVMGGKGFGHAAIVIEGAKDSCIENLLGKALIFESQAHDVPIEYQLRQASGYLKGDDFRFANVNFGKQNENYRYRLRPDIPVKQKQKIIEFILKQDPDTSCWRSLKSFEYTSSVHRKEDQIKDKNQWYCSLLIWQAFYTIAGIDLDINQGVMVYPNDLIAHPFFDNTADNKEKRVRF
jgi:hypothetical protein